MERRHLIVAIAVPIYGDGHVVGTGCAITDDLVLTARHVVFPSGRDEGRDIAVYLGAGHGVTIEQCTKVDLERDCIAWDGDNSGNKLDAVLLRCPRLQGWQGPPVSLAGSLSSFSKWVSRGYPRAAITPGQPLAPADFSGKLHAPIAPDKFAQAVEISGPSEENGWKGASGMPLFSLAGELLGLAFEVPKNFRAERVNVVPASRLLADPDFKALIQKDDFDFQAFRTRMEEKLAGLLLDNDSVAAALAGRDYYNVNLTDRRERAETTAAKIVDSTPEDLLDLLYKIRRDEPGVAKDSKSLGAISAIMHAALPILDDPAVRNAAQRARMNVKPDPVPLGIAMRTVAEIAMALADGQTASFARVPHDEPDVPGRFALEPLPLAGRNGDGQQTQRDLMQAMEQHLDESFITGSARGRFLQGDLEARIRHINTCLVRRLKNDGRRYYYAAILPEGEPQRHAIYMDMKSLKERFPAIAFLMLDSDTVRYSDETARYANVADLCRDE